MLHNVVVLQGTTPTEAPTITEGATVVATKVEEVTTQVAPVHPVLTGPIETADALKADNPTTGKIIVPALSLHRCKKACALAAESPQITNEKIVGTLRLTAIIAERKGTSHPYAAHPRNKKQQQGALHPSSKDPLVVSQQPLTT